MGPEHSWLKDIGRVKYFSATDQEALDAFMLLSKLEGIIPALESAHALAHVAQVAPQMTQGPDHRRLPVGPRRQGCVLGRRGAGRKNMSRHRGQRFAELKTEGRAAFVPFITAGDPDFETSLRDSGSSCRRRAPM